MQKQMFKYIWECPITLENTEKSGGAIIKPHKTDKNEKCSPNGVMSGKGFISLSKNLKCYICKTLITYDFIEDILNKEDYEKHEQLIRSQEITKRFLQEHELKLKEEATLINIMRMLKQITYSINNLSDRVEKLEIAQGITTENIVNRKKEMKYITRNAFIKYPYILQHFIGLIKTDPECDTYCIISDIEQYYALSDILTIDIFRSECYKIGLINNIDGVNYNEYIRATLAGMRVPILQVMSTTVVDSPQHEILKNLYDMFSDLHTMYC